MDIIFKTKYVFKIAKTVNLNFMITNSQNVFIPVQLVILEIFKSMIVRAVKVNLILDANFAILNNAFSVKILILNLSIKLVFKIALKDLSLIINQ